MPKKTKAKTAKKSEKLEDASKVVKISQEEFEKKVMELADAGLTSEKIGEKLRQEGIHPKEYQKKISKILGNKYLSPELKNTEARLEKIKKHYEKHKQDKRAMRDKDRVYAQLRKIKRYLKVENK